MLKHIVILVTVFLFIGCESKKDEAKISETSNVTQELDDNETLETNEDDNETSNEQEVLNNTPPTIYIIDSIDVAENGSKSISFTVTDQEQTKAWFTATATEGNVTISINPLSLLYTAPYGFTGTDNIELNVSDGYDTSTAIITVNIMPLWRVAPDSPELASSNPWRSLPEKPSVTGVNPVTEVWEIIPNPPIQTNN